MSATKRAVSTAQTNSNGSEHTSVNPKIARGSNFLKKLMLIFNQGTKKSRGLISQIFLTLVIATILWCGMGYVSTGSPTWGLDLSHINFNKWNPLGQARENQVHTLFILFGLLTLLEERRDEIFHKRGIS
jgi:hypothetical protein